MRNLIVLVTLLFSVSAMAEMPKYLEGATVTVTLKNGKTYEYKSDEMAVVPRSNLDVNAAKVAAFHTLHKKLVSKEIVKNKKHRVYGLLGYGPTGNLKTSTNGSKYKTEHEEGAVFGVGYQFKLSEDLNIGGQVQSNETFSLSVGTDF